MNFIQESKNHICKTTSKIQSSQTIMKHSQYPFTFQHEPPYQTHISIHLPHRTTSNNRKPSQEKLPKREAIPIQLTFTDCIVPKDRPTLAYRLGDDLTLPAARRG